MLPTLRGEQSGYYQYQLDPNSHPLQPRKGEFCPFIVAHFQGSVKNRRNIYADLQNDGQERKEHQKRRPAKISCAYQLYGQFWKVSSDRPCGVRCRDG